MPVTVSLRYSRANSASFGSTGVSRATVRFATAPLAVMTTTIAICGCSTSTSTCRITVVERAGADATASRFVTWDSASVVARSAESISRCAVVRSTASSCTGARSAISSSTR